MHIPNLLVAEMQQRLPLRLVTTVSPSFPLFPSLPAPPSSSIERNPPVLHATHLNPSASRLARPTGDPTRQEGHAHTLPGDSPPAVISYRTQRECLAGWLALQVRGCAVTTADRELGR